MPSKPRDRRFTQRELHAIVFDQSVICAERAKRDLDAQTKYAQGYLTPRQAAGFYEVMGDEIRERTKRYREQAALVRKAALWRRAHPEPLAEHIVLRNPFTGAIEGIRAGDMSPEYGAYRRAYSEWSQLPKGKKAKTPVPTPPAGPEEIKHDRWLTNNTYAGVNGSMGCPACTYYRKAIVKWRAARVAFMASIGIDLSDSNPNWHGTDETIYPDGSWQCELKYPALPIRGASIGGRIPDRRYLALTLTKED